MQRVDYGLRLTGLSWHQHLPEMVHTPGVLPRITLYLTCYRLKQTEGDEVREESETGQVSVGPRAAWTSGKDCEW